MRRFDITINKMKQRFFTLLLLAAVCFSSCQKDAVEPSATQNQVSPKVTATTTSVLNQDTVNTAINGYMRIQLAEDAVNTDNIIVDFKPGSSTAFVRNEDAPTLEGFGAVSLSSLSSDNVALAINVMPLTSKGVSIPLVVGAKATGIYKLNLMAVNDIPASFDIWLMDKYKKDSLDFRNNPTYAFNLTKTDTSSFGSHRFNLVVREK
jgi:hypothetical protein